MLERIASEGVVAVVIKPGRVGGFERSASIAAWAHSRGMAAVISSAFESSVGLSAYAQLAAHVDARFPQTLSPLQQGPVAQSLPMAHGLGTFTWLGGDVVESRKFEVVQETRAVVVRPGKTPTARNDCCFNDEFVTSSRIEGVIESRAVSVASGNKVFEFHVWDSKTAVEESAPTLLFLHGFLGTGRDWLPIMTALASSFRCIAVDLPGHGLTKVNNMDDNGVSVKAVSDALLSLLEELRISGVVPIGYSMGARIALYLSLHHSDKVSAVVSVSGSPGLEDEKLRKARASGDSILAQTLKEGTLESFLDFWYQQPLWESLRRHPNFAKLRKERLSHRNKDALASVLESLSAGLQPSLWEKITELATPALLVTGSLDTKFVSIAHKMLDRAGQEPQKKGPRAQKKSRAQRRGDWDSEELKLPFDVREEFPDVNTLFPSLGGLPQDDGFAAFVAQEMKKMKLEDTLALEAEDPLAQEGGVKITTHNALQVAELEGCGHAVHFENPLELARLLRMFLCQTDTTLSAPS